MNKIALSILSGAIGLAIGAVGTYILVKKKYEEMYYDELHKAIDEECERLRKNRGSTDSKEAPVISFDISEEDAKIIKERIESEDKSPVSILNSYQECVIDVSRLTAQELRKNKDGEPRFIDEDEFRFLPERYEIRELQYLLQDGTVLDVNDEMVDDPGIYISGLEEEIKKMYDGEAAYILVEYLGVAVELVALDTSYQSMFGEDLNE